MSTSNNRNRLQRRGFLRLFAIGLGYLAIPQLASAASDRVSLRKGSKLYKGRFGRLFTSADNGKNWKQIANFGKYANIVDIKPASKGWVKLSIEENGSAYSLYSKNDRHWISKDYDSTTVQQ